MSSPTDNRASASASVNESKESPSASGAICGSLGRSANAGTSEGGVGGALCGSGKGRGLPRSCFTQRSRHDCHGCCGCCVAFSDRLSRALPNEFYLPSLRAACRSRYPVYHHSSEDFHGPNSRVYGLRLLCIFAESLSEVE